MLSTLLQDILIANIAFPFNEALPGVLGNRGTRTFVSAEQRSKNAGNREKKAILRNREHRK